MLDLTPRQILEIIFPVLEADQFQDLFPDLDLEISISQLNVIIVIAWVTQQIIVSDVRIEILHVDNQIKVGEIDYRNFKRYSNYRQDSGYRTPNPPQRKVNFSEPPMYSDFTDRESMISVDSVVPTYRKTSDPIEEVFQMQNEKCY